MKSNSIAYLDVLWTAAVGMLLKVVLGAEGRKEVLRERHKEGGREGRNKGRKERR